GAGISDAEEELKRTLPVIEAIAERFPEAWISVDTYHARVAKETIAAGASMINDVSSGRFDEKMFETVASSGVPYIAMHMQGKPENMQDNPRYEDVVYEVRDELIKTSERARQAGIRDIILDPGFGFGKTLDHNF